MSLKYTHAPLSDVVVVGLQCSNNFSSETAGNFMEYPQEMGPF